MSLIFTASFVSLCKDVAVTYVDSCYHDLLTLKKFCITVPDNSSWSNVCYMTTGWLWTLKKTERQRIDAFQLRCWRRLLKSPLDSKEIKPVNPKGNRPWIFIGITDAEVEAPVFWSSDENSQFTGKVPDAGKDWGQKEKRMSKDERAGWHHQCKWHELGQTLGDAEGQGGLVCGSLWGHKELDTTGQLNTMCVITALFKNCHCFCFPDS